MILLKSRKEHNSFSNTYSTVHIETFTKLKINKAELSRNSSLYTVDNFDSKFTFFRTTVDPLKLS